MADQNDVQLQIIAKLQDLASAPLAKLTQEVQRFADAAPRAAQGAGAALDAQLDRAEHDAQRVVETVRSVQSASATGAQGSAGSTVATETQAATVAVQAYVESLRFQSAALTLSNTERAEAVALLHAEGVALAAGTQVTDAQRAAILEEIRARETYSSVLAGQAQRAVGAAQATSDALAREDAQRRVTFATLREDILTRDREGTARRDAARDAEAYLDALRDERRLLGLTADERGVALALQRAEVISDKLGTREKVEFTNAIERETRALQRERGELERSPRGTGRSGSSVLGGLSSISTLVPGRGLAQVTSQAASAAQAVESIGLAAGSSTAALGPIAIAAAAVAADLAVAALAAKGLMVAFERSSALTEALRPIATASAAGAEKIEQLRTSVRALSVDTGRSVEELGRAASAFKDLAPEARIVALGASVRLARAGLIDAAASAQALDRVLDSFGESAASAAKRADQLFVASIAGEVGVDAFADAVARVGPLATQLGIPFEQVSDTLAKIAKRTGDAGQGAQALSTIFAQLSDPTSQLSSELRRAGVDASAFALQTRGVNAVFADIGRFLERHPDLSTQLFGSPRTSRAAFAALQDSGTATLALMQDQERASDATAAAIERSSTASESLRKIWTRIVDLSGLNQLGDTVEKALKKAGDASEGAAKKAGDAKSRFIAEGVRDFFLPLGLPAAVSRFRERLAAEQAAQSEQAAREATASAAAAAQAEARVTMPLIAAAALEAVKASLPAAAKLTLPFDVRATEEAARKTIGQALEALKRTGVPEVELPVLVREAVTELGKTGLDAPSAAAAAAQTKSITDYTSVLQAAAELQRRLSTETLAGSERALAASRNARAATLREIEALQAKGVNVDELRNSLQALTVEQEKSAAIERELSTDDARLRAAGAAVEQLQQTEALARARGEIARADALAVLIEERQLALAEEAARIDAIRSRERAKGNADGQDAIEQANAGRSRARKLEQDVLAVVRARAVEERQRDNLAAIRSNRAAVLDGLDGEIARIKEAARAEADRAKAGIDGATPDVQSRLASDAEAALTLGNRAVRQAISNAHEFISSSLSDLISQVATTPAEAAAAERVVAIAADSRLRAQLVLNKATEEELAIFDRLIARQHQLADGATRAAKLFGDSSIENLVIKAEIDLQTDALDVKLREEIEPIIAGLRALFTSGADDNTLSLALEDARARMRALRDEATQTAEWFGTAFSAQLADRVREFGDATKQAQFAADAFADSFTDNAARALEDFAKGAKSAGDAAKDFARGLVADMLSAASKLAANQLFSTIFGALLGGGDPRRGLPAGFIGPPQALGGILPGQVVDTRAFAAGGVATRPSLALFAEKPGMAEAFVPLPGPNRGIPVEFKGGALRRDRDRSQPITVQISVTHAPNIQALDARGVQEVLAREATTLADLVAMKLSDGSHAGLRASVARASR